MVMWFGVIFPLHLASKLEKNKPWSCQSGYWCSYKTS